MQYLLLIYEAESVGAALSEAETGAVMGEYHRFTESIKNSKNYVGGNPLQPVSTATAVRIRDGKQVVTDGPFAETREQLGGYYLVEAPHLDEAIAMAARIPAAKTGTIEIRPIWVFEG